MEEFKRFDVIVSDLQKEVELYQELYGNPEAVSVLNKVSVPVFSVIQKAMLFEIITRIAALFDPAKNQKDANLSIHYLLQRVEGKLADETEKLVEETIDLYESTGIKKLRNKTLAHFDLKQYLGKRVLATNVSYETVADILIKLKAILRTIPVEAGILAPGHVIYRDSSLPVNNGGIVFLEKLQAIDKK